jgi:hypothetical protein
MSEDGPDPFDATLRASLERLRATPDPPAVEERLGLVERLGCRRRQRRALARGGAVAVVVTILAVSVVSALGRVEGASDRNVQLWGRPPATGRGEAGPGTTLVAGEQPEDETTTTVPTTTTTTVPTVPGDDRNLQQPGSGQRAAPSTSPSATHTTVPTIQAPTTLAPGFGKNDGLITPPANCAQYDEIADSTVTIRYSGVDVPQCHTVARDGQLSFARADEINGMSLDIRSGSGVVAHLASPAPVTVGPVATFMEPRRWVFFRVRSSPADLPYTDLYIIAV